LEKTLINYLLKYYPEYQMYATCTLKKNERKMRFI
jgi:hypothetical protein